MEKIKVLIVEDSKTMQAWLSKILESDPTIQVIGLASDPFIAREMIKNVEPDVVTLDIIMPKMDGITFLKNLMRLHPLPVIMISSLTEQGSRIALEALALGAVDYFPKPTDFELKHVDKYADKLIQVIKNVSKINISSMPYVSENKSTVEHLSYQSNFLKNILIVIGGSTGGIEAIESILSQLPKTFPPIIIAQHIRAEFSKPFANRINKILRLHVKEPINHEEIKPSTVYIVPGNVNLTIQKSNNKYYCKLTAPVSPQEHTPSINCLFSSAALVFKESTIAVLLTGMGDDGAIGAKQIHDAGGTVIVQDKESSMIWGMPGAAVKLKATDYVVNLKKIPEILFKVLDEIASKQRG